MDKATRRVIEDLDFWCLKKESKIIASDIPLHQGDFKFYVLDLLQPVDVFRQSDMRMAELLLALKYWASDPSRKARLYPTSDRISKLGAKRWFAARTAIILGKIRL